MNTRVTSLLLLCLLAGCRAGPSEMARDAAPSAGPEIDGSSSGNAPVDGGDVPAAMDAGAQLDASDPDDAVIATRAMAAPTQQLRMLGWVGSSGSRPSTCRTSDPPRLAVPRTLRDTWLRSVATI